MAEDPKCHVRSAGGVITTLDVGRVDQDLEDRLTTGICERCRADCGRLLIIGEEGLCSGCIRAEFQTPTKPHGVINDHTNQTKRRQRLHPGS